MARNGVVSDGTVTKENTTNDGVVEGKQGNGLQLNGLSERNIGNQEKGANEDINLASNSEDTNEALDNDVESWQYSE